MAELVAELAFAGSSTSPTPCASRSSRSPTARWSSSFDVAEDDIGSRIGVGRAGLACALRTIVRAGGVEAGRRVQLEIGISAERRPRGTELTKERRRRHARRRSG